MKLSTLVLCLALSVSSNIFSQGADPLEPDTLEVLGGTLTVGQSSPIFVRIFSDSLIAGFSTGFAIKSIDGGFAKFDSAVFMGRMSNPLVLNDRFQGTSDDDGVPPDIFYVVATQGPAFDLPEGDDSLFAVYLTGLSEGEISLDSSYFPPGGDFLFIAANPAIPYFDHVPQFKSATIQVNSGPMPPIITASSDIYSLAINSTLLFDLTSSSPSDLVGNLELLSLHKYDDETQLSSVQPSLTTTNPATFSWSPGSIDVGIWLATFTVCNIDNRCDTLELTIQVLSSTDNIINFNITETDNFLFTTQITSGDFDGDMYPEIIASSIPHYYTSSVSTYNYTPGFGFTQQFELFDSNIKRGVIPGFYDSDSYLDFLLVSRDITGNNLDPITVYAGNGDNSFQILAESNTISPVKNSMVSMGNFTGNDQRLDLATVKSDVIGVEIYTGSDSASFTYATTTVPSANVRSLNSADLNRDGNDDLVVGTDNGVEIYLGDGMGGFTVSDQFIQTYGTFQAEITNEGSDFDNNGTFDLCLATPSVSGTHSEIVVYLGNGDGTFVQQVVRTLKGHIFANRSADINGDGELDIVYANGSEKCVGILFGNGDGTFTDEIRYQVEKYVPFRLCCLDIDLDGDIDIALSSQELNSGFSLYLFENQLDPTGIEQVQVEILAKDNIEFTLTSELGKELRNFKNTMASASMYQRDLDGNAIFDDYATMGVIEDGRYLINTKPKPGVATGENFSLEFNIAGSPFRLAKDIPMNEFGYNFAIYPTGYSPVAPDPGSFVIQNPPTFSWYNIATEYDFQLADNPDFINPIVSTVISGTSYTHTEPLPLVDTASYFWRKKPTGDSEFSPIYTVNLVSGFDPNCCIGIRGNINSDPQEAINISDVTFLVYYLFGIPTGTPPRCIEEANANSDPEEQTNIADVSYLVNYLFGNPSGPAPQSCP